MAKASSNNRSYWGLTSYTWPEVFTSWAKPIVVFEYLCMILLFNCWTSNFHISFIFILAKSVNLILVTYILRYEWYAFLPIPISSTYILQLIRPLTAFWANSILNVSWYWVYLNLSAMLHICYLWWYPCRWSKSKTKLSLQKVLILLGGCPNLDRFFPPIAMSRVGNSRAVVDNSDIGIHTTWILFDLVLILILRI